MLPQLKKGAKKTHNIQWKPVSNLIFSQWKPVSNLIFSMCIILHRLGRQGDWKSASDPRKITCEGFICCKLCCQM